MFLFFCTVQVHSVNATLYIDLILCFSKIDALGEILFGDWIWDTCLLQKKTEESDDFQSVAAATGHNAVWIWNLKQNTKFQVSQCEEQCILYPF